MTTYLINLSKNYLTNYSGLSMLCWQGIFLNCLESTLIGVYYFLPLYFVNELHLTITASGIIISFYGIGTIFGGFLGGKLSDQLSPGFISVLSLFLQTLNFFILLNLTSPPLLTINLFFMGIASYGFITSNSLWVLSQCKNDEMTRLKSINLLNVASNLGFGLAAVMMGIFANFSFHYILSFSTVLLLLSAIYSIFINHAGKNCISIDSVTKKEKVGLSYVETNKIIWVILICLFLVGLIIFQLNTTYSLYIQDTFKPLGMKSLSILFALNCFLVVFLQAPIVNIFRHTNKVFIAGMGAFLLGFGMFILIFSSNLILAMLASIVYTLGEILFFSVAQLICYQSGPINRKGRMMGIYRMIYACSRVVAPTAGGFVYQQLGSRVLWFICGVIGLFCLGICNHYKKYADGSV